MVSANLKEPFLSLALEPVARIKQNDEVAVGGIWSVLSKVGTAVAEGRRLENLTWRLWFQARKWSKDGSSQSLSHDLPLVQATPPLRPPIVSCPSLTLSCSSEETNTSSDWEHETAVNEDDELQRKTAISPPTKFARTSLYLASPGVVPLHQEINAGSNDAAQRWPPAASESHDWFQTSMEVRRKSIHSQEAAVPPSEAQYQSTGTPGVSLRPHLPGSPQMSPPNETVQRIFSTTSISQTAPPPSGQGVHDNQPSLPSKVSVSSSVPITSVVERDRQTVGTLVVSVLSDKAMPPSRRPHVRIQAPLPTSEDRTAVTVPGIVEPQLPMLRSPRMRAGSGSALTSATSTPRQAFPTVIVVNPTPHPTPPTTPLQDLPEFRSDLTTITTSSPINRPEKSESLDEITGSINGQLATPVSVNGDTKPGSVDNNNHVDEVENEARSGQSHKQIITSRNDHARELTPAEPPALSDESVVCDISSRSPPSATEPLRGPPQTEMGTSNIMSSPAPIPAPQPSEEKKFFLAAPRSGSGGSSHSTESPDSTRLGSPSPSRRCIHATSTLARDTIRHREDRHQEDEVASSFSTSSHPQSVASSKGGLPKRGPTFTVAGANRKRQGVKKTALYNHRREHSLTDHASDREKPVCKSKDRVKEKEKAKLKETDNSQMAQTTSNLVYGTKPLQRVPSHRSNLTGLAPHQLRQLPTNPPPPRQASTTQPEFPNQLQTTAIQQNNRHLPLFPQLGNPLLGHLPTVPPKPRRPIEITSSDYSTDTDDDGSSWESESASVEEVKNDDKPSGSKDNAAGPSHAKKPDAIAKNNRARDPGEMARDAALEAQRQRELFKKLPPRSYSNLGQLPRTKSGLSILFKPDPEVFPEGHPYRSSRSSQDLLPRNWSAPAPPPALISIKNRAGVAAPLQDSVTVVSVNSKGDLARMVKGQNPNASSRNGYRPRAKPADQDEETETDEDDPEDVIQVSNSVAERRLAILIGRRTRKSPPAPPQAAAQQSGSPLAQPITRTATLPVEMMRQYLAGPAPLQTPHTIRKNIISQELNDDLRRNLLAERSNNNQVQGRPPRAQGSILPGPWKLTPIRPLGEEQKKPSADPQDRSFATQRTKSWAGDYHASGW